MEACIAASHEISPAELPHEALHGTAATMVQGECLLSPVPLSLICEFTIIPDRDPQLEARYA